MLDDAYFHDFDIATKFRKLQQVVAYRHVATYGHCEATTTGADYDNDQVEHHVEKLECKCHVKCKLASSNLKFPDMPKKLTKSFRLVCLKVQNCEVKNPRLPRFGKQFDHHQMMTPPMSSPATSAANHQTASVLLLSSVPVLYPV